MQLRVLLRQVFKFSLNVARPIKLINLAHRAEAQRGEMVLNLPQMVLLPPSSQNMCTAPSADAHDDIRAQQPLPESAFSTTTTTTKAAYEAVQTPPRGS